MEFTIKKSDFQYLLRWSQGIAEKKSTTPILSHLLLETVEGKLRISATDLEVATIVERSAEIKKEGKAVVNAKSLFDIVREAPQEIIFFSKKDSSSIEIKSGKSIFKIVGMSPENFPQIPSVSENSSGSSHCVKMVLSASDLSDMIQKTLYAVSSDETRYLLTGLHWFVSEREDGTYLMIIATDSHRLSRVERKIARPVSSKPDGDSGPSSLHKGIIISRRGISELKKILSESDEDFSVMLDENVIVFQSSKNNLSLMIRLMEGQANAYEKSIPQSLEKVVLIEKNLMIGALKRSMILTEDEGRGVKFSFSPGCLETSASQTGLGESKEEIAVNYKGGAFQVGFNPRFFLDALNVLEDSQVVMEFQDNISPCLIRSEFDRGFLALVMPIRV